MKEIELLEYVTETGRNPFREWLLSLKEIKTRSRIRARLNRIRLGNMGDCKAVGEGVFEVRINFGPGYRVYFGQQRHALVLLLCGGDKRSQANDILRAKKYWETSKILSAP